MSFEDFGVWIAIITAAWSFWQEIRINKLCENCPYAPFNKAKIKNKEIKPATAS